MTFPFEITQWKQHPLRAVAVALGAGQTNAVVTFWPMDDATSSTTCVAFSDPVIPGLGSQALTLRDGSATATAKTALVSLTSASGCRIYKMTGATYGFVAPDHADFEFGDGAVDMPFSFCCWISADSLPVGVNGRWVLSKRYWSTSPGEYSFGLGSSSSAMYGYLRDASVPSAEYLQFTSNVGATLFHPVCFTYDGTETAPTLLLYRADGGRLGAQHHVQRDTDRAQHPLRR